MRPLLTTLTCLIASCTALSAVPAAQAAPLHTRVPQAWAKSHHVNLKQGARDSDKDGLSNWGEYRAGTDPRRADSDRDGISDALENRDRDELVNADEIAAGTDPRKRDSDRDGISDGREDRDRDGLRNVDERPTGHAINNRDSDADGILDGLDNAGQITAVSATSVTIRLFVGGTLTANLSGASFVACSSTALVPTSVAGAAAPASTPAAGSSKGSTEPGDASSGDSTDSPGDGADPVGADDGPVADPDSGETVADDPARASFARASQAPEDGDDSGDWGDPAADVSDPVDLGACAGAMKIGAIVHKATVENSTLADLQLMKG